MKKRILPLLLCLVMALSLLPTAAFAADGDTTHITNSNANYDNYVTDLYLTRQDNGKYTVKLECSNLYNISGHPGDEIDGIIDWMITDGDGSDITGLSYWRHEEVSISLPTYWSATEADVALEAGHTYRLYCIGVDDGGNDVWAPAPMEFKVPASAADSKIEISVIRATSDIMTPEYGAAVKIPNFTITEGAGAYFATNNGGWHPGQLRGGKTFGAADYYYQTQIRIDDDNANYYKLSSALKVYVNDVEWTVVSVINTDTYSMVWVNSPVTTTTEPVGEPLAVNVPSSYKVAAGEMGTLVSSLNFANCVSGGTKPYTYTKVSGPDWLTLSSGGVLSGTRPNTASDATSFVLRIADSKGASKDITVPVGAVTVRQEISVIRADSDIMTPEYGAAVKIPNFTITEGAGAYFATNNGGWHPGQLRGGKTFGAADYYYQTQIRIDDDNANYYKLSSALKVYVNDVEWTVVSVINTDTYSMVWVNSPVTTTAEPTETRAVAFNMNGHGTAIDAQTVEVGGMATKPADPTASGYTFGGWYTDSACTTAFDFDTSITDSITLYAKWTKDIEAVTGITITVPAPVVGKTRTEAAKIATVTSTPANAVVITDGDWWKAEDGNYMTGTFEAGKTYQFGLYINPKTGYQLNMSGDNYLGEINATNGTVAFTEANGTGGFFLAVNVECVETRTTINNIGITVAAPVVGKTAAECMFVPAVTTGPADAAEFDAAESKWTDSNGNWFNGTFEVGKQYHYIVALKAKEGYRFPQSDEKYTGTVNVSGAGLYYPGANENGQYVYLDLRMTPTCTHANTEVKNAKAATCTATGYTGDTVCKDCGKVITAGEVIPKLTPTAPAVPELNISKADGKITISWNAVSGANKYWIYRSTDGINFKYYDMTTKTSYTNSSVTSGTKYYYKVKAVKTVDGKDYASSYSAAKNTIPLTTPALSISKTAGKIKLSWGAVTGATKYWIYRSTDGVNFKYYDATTNTSYTNSSVTSGTKYYYKVKAVKNVNGTDWVSSYSAVKSTVPMTTPTLSATLSSGKVKLSWGSVTGATKYWIYRSTDGTNFSYYDSATNTSYTNSSVTAGKTYYYKIKAVKTINSTDWASDYSNVVSKKP